MAGHQAIAATFVEPRGMIRSVVAGVAGREVLGTVGSAVASAAASGGSAAASPLRAGSIAHLSVSADEIVLFAAKRGAFRPKATDEVVASAPRSTVERATLEKGRIAGVLEISFAGGSTWAFDIPKIYLGGAQQVTAVLAPFGGS
jgi:hypothetical protein